MSIEIPQVNFVKGEVSPIAAARTDQDFYSSAVSLARNVFIRAEGGASNRPGLQYVATCSTPSPYGSCLLPFIYNNQQSYLTEFAAGTISIYAQGSLVQAGIATPYASADIYNLRWAQSADILNVVVTTQQPYQLKRLTATSFTYTIPSLVNGPFQDVNIDSTTYMYASGTQGSVTITCSKAIFTSAHLGALVSIQEQFLSGIEAWEANKILTKGGLPATPVGQYCRSDGKIYVCVNAGVSGNQTMTGSFQPVHTSGTQMDGNGNTVLSVADVVGVSWQFVSSGTGVAQITSIISPTQVQATVQSDKGVWSNFPPTVVGPPVVVVGPFTFTGDGTTKVFQSLTAITTGDPNQYLVTVAGVFQDPSTYVVSVSGLSIDFFTAPAAGAAIAITQVTGTGTGAAIQITSLPVSTYWALGSFSPIQGWPATVVYFNDRLVFGGTTLQPQTFFTTKTAIYNDFGVSNPQVSDDGITATINARRENPIVDLIPLNDLLISTASAIWRVTHSASVGAITPSDISLLPQNFYGAQNVPSVQTGDTVIYAQWGGRKIRDLVYQFAYDKFLGTELTVSARQIFPYGVTVTRMAFAPEPYGLLFCVRSDGVLAVCTYLPEQRVIAWTHYDTLGFFEDVCVLPENGTFVTYVIVRRTIAGKTVRYIEKFAAREYASIQDAFFVDSGLTYDGRNSGIASMTFSSTVPSPMSGDPGTLVASTAQFAATDVTNKNEIWFTDSSGNVLCKFRITGFVSATSVSVIALAPVPAGTGITSSWTFARSTFSGLANLAGQTVSIYADGAVMTPQIVSASGTFSLPTPGGVIHAGLGYVSQLQSMNLNMQGQPTIRNKSKTVVSISCIVDESAPFEAGPSFGALSPVQQREFENYGDPVNLYTGVLFAQFLTDSSDDEVICIQQADPVPLTLLGWVAAVDIGQAQ